MSHRFKTKCNKCGAFLLVMETNDNWPGCKEREEANCPICGRVVYTSMTSGFLSVVEITEEDHHKKEDY